MIGELMKQYCERENISSEEYAERLECRPNVVEMMMNGKPVFPSKKTLEKIAETIGISAESIQKIARLEMNGQILAIHGSSNTAQKENT